MILEPGLIVCASRVRCGRRTLAEEDVVRTELEFITQYQQELATGQGKSGGVDEDARYLAGG